MTIDINANFRKNFCSKIIDKDYDPKLLNVEECRVRTRDVAKNFFKPEQPQQQEPVESKFTKMWKLRETNWDKLTNEQKIVCDLNLKWLSPSKFQEKMEELNSIEADRYKFINSFDISIPGFDDDDILRLKTELITKGKVGIDSERRIIKAKDLDLLTENDNIVKINCTSDVNFPLFVIMPNNLKWYLDSGEKTILWNTRKLCNRRIFLDVENKFYFDSKHAFDITCSKKGELPLSSQVSEYETVNGHEDPVPPEFLIILKHEGNKDYFHLFSLIQAMLSQNDALNPMNQDPVPPEILNKIAKKIGVNANDFANIWKRAEEECPRKQDRPHYRLQLFREMIRSESGSPDDCEKRKIAINLMSQRRDWKMLL